MQRVTVRLLWVLGPTIAALLLWTAEVDLEVIFALIAASMLVVPVARSAAIRLADAKAEDFLAGSMERWTLLFGLLTLLSSSLALLLLGPSLWWLSPLLGWALTAVVFWMSARLWIIPLAPIFRLRDVVERGAQAEELLDGLVASFEDGPRPERGIALRRHAGRAFTAAGVLAKALRFEAMARVLLTVPVDGLDPARRAILGANLAVARLYRHDLAGARRAVDDALAHAKDPELRKVLPLTDALCAALEGDGDRALAMLSEKAPKEPRLERAWLLARAHALALTGDESQARECLDRLLQLDPRGVERVRLLGGPAAHLVAEG